MNREMLAKAKGTKSAEELAAFAKENGVELSEEEAHAYFTQLHASGELADDELDSVAGGGCQTKVNGENYTVVSSGLRCFTGKFEPYWDDGGNYKAGAVPRGDAWSCFSAYGCCGKCYHLGFKKGLGYCKAEH